MYCFNTFPRHLLGFSQFRVSELTFITLMEREIFPFTLLNADVHNLHAEYEHLASRLVDGVETLSIRTSKYYDTSSPLAPENEVPSKSPLKALKGADEG